MKDTPAAPDSKARLLAMLKDLELELASELLAGEDLPAVSAEGIHRHLAGCWPVPQVPVQNGFELPPCPLPSALDMLKALLLRDAQTPGSRGSGGFLRD